MPREFLRPINAPIRKKYVLQGGWIISDGRRQYVPGQNLIELYGLNWQECVVLQEGEEVMFCPRLRGLRPEQIVVLRPRSDGNYTLQK